MNERGCHDVRNAIRVGGIVERNGIGWEILWHPNLILCHIPLPPMLLDDFEKQELMSFFQGTARF